MVCEYVGLRAGIYLLTYIRLEDVPTIHRVAEGRWGGGGF